MKSTLSSPCMLIALLSNLCPSCAATPASAAPAVLPTRAATLLAAAMPGGSTAPATSASQDPLSAESVPASRPRRAPRALAPRAPTEWERLAHAHERVAAMSEAKQRELVGWFEVEVGQLQGFQARLIQFVRSMETTDPGLWPELEALSWFDPQTHAPAQPIPRRLLAPDDDAVAAASRQILGAIEARQLQSGWTYDYAKREPRRLPDEADARRVLENGLLGMPPGWDYAEAVVEGMLDDGSLQKSFAGFANAYTDRTGGVYPNITLYDAWASSTAIEMPDVDCVGLIHHILGDWTSWKAVITPEQQEPLYTKLGELFRAVHHHRSLRHNLARVFVCGSTELRDKYQHNLDLFHTMWEESSSTPATLREKLPSPENWASFLQGYADEVAKDELRSLRGIRRRYTLDQDAAKVRTLLLSLLDQFDS